MERPNLFQYARKELSQDAFLCWLLDWANAECATIDPSLHRAGLAFLNALLAKHGRAPQVAPKVTVKTQVKAVDIVAEINDDVVLSIEDKVDAVESGNQLQRYSIALTQEYPERIVLPVFLKTGDQSDYREVEKSHYKPFLREDLLTTLRATAQGVGCAIFLDFLEHLEEKERWIQSYLTSPVSEWTQMWDPWIGFYQELQRHLDLEWRYVANPSGGFYGGWWNILPWKGCEVYLQIEQGPLTFRINTGDKDEKQRLVLRDRWARAIMAAAEHSRMLVVRRPKRMGAGATMSVACVDPPDWIAQTHEGLLDKEATLKNLGAAERTMRRALKEP